MKCDNCSLSIEECARKLKRTGSPCCSNCYHSVEI